MDPTQATLVNGLAALGAVCGTYMLSAPILNRIGEMLGIQQPHPRQSFKLYKLSGYIATKSDVDVLSRRIHELSNKIDELQVCIWIFIISLDRRLIS